MNVKMAGLGVWIVFCTAVFGAEESRLVEQWQCGALDTPEAVLYDAARNTLYVSNIAGKPAEKDGNGFISRITLDGHMETLKWADGLDAPKGMAIHGDRLYVSDIDELVAIDLESGKVKARYSAPESGFLNDVAADAAGNIYVSDSSPEGSAIYRLSEGQLELWLRDPSIIRPNGLHMLADRLLVGNAKQGGLHAVLLETKKVLPVAQAKTGIDGLKPFGAGAYLISNWAGQTSLVTASGETVPLLDTTPEGINAADFEYIPERELVIIPTFFDHRVVAYQIK
jgi:hypothetical protein